MILTVTLNAALDATYPVASLIRHGSHRVLDARNRAGGKGINVARVLHQVGEPVVATGLVGGGTGAEIRADLHAAGVAHRFADIAEQSRRTVAVVAADTGNTTIFNEAGPNVTDAEWAGFLALYDELLTDADLVVCSGSLPAGRGTDTYADLVRRAGSVPVIVDCAGPALLAAAAAGAALVKPNLDEIRATTELTDPVAGGRVLLQRGARSVVVSLGADGLIGLTHDRAWAARGAERLAGNPTGAGDACVAALAVGLRDDAAWPDRLRTAVAWSAGAVVAPLAGEIDAETSARTAKTVTIEEQHGTDTDR